MEINNQWISEMTDRETVHLDNLVYRNATPPHKTENPAEPKAVDVDSILDAAEWK